MKKTIITALIAAICVAPAFAAGQSISAKSIGIGYEYTTLNIEGNADWTMNSAVIRGSYDFYKFDNGITVSMTGAAYYGVGTISYEGEVEDTDTTRMGGKIGLMFNYQATERVTIFAGPTVGYNVFSYDTTDQFKKVFDKEMDDDTGVTYGVTAGIRYTLSNQKTSIEAGVSFESAALSGADDEFKAPDGSMYKKWDKSSIGSTSFFAGINHAF